MNPEELSALWRSSPLSALKDNWSVRKRRVEPKAKEMIQKRGWTQEKMYDYIVDLLADLDFLHEEKK